MSELESHPAPDGSPSKTTRHETRLGPAEQAALGRRADAAREQARQAAARYLRTVAQAEERLVVTSRLLAESAEARVVIKEEVARYARSLRALDTPPEQGLLLVKDAIEKCSSTLGPEKRQLLDSVVRWYVESYFAA